MRNKYLLTISLIFSLTLLLIQFATAVETSPYTLENLALPEELGKVQERWVAPDPKRGWVIHIQDVHAHFIAQENIAAILEHLNTHYGIKTVAVEGAWKAFTFPQSWGLPASQQKQMLARALMEKDYITGPIHAALFVQTPINVFGIEERELYLQNGRVYREHLNQRIQTIEKIAAAEKEFANQKTSLFNPELAQFDTALQAFYQANLGEMKKSEQAQSFMVLLLEWCHKKEIDVTDLPQINIFSQLYAIQQSIDKSKLESQAQRLMQAFKHDGLGFEELLRNNLVPEEKLEFYTEIKKYRQLIKIQDRLAPQQFFNEIEAAVTRVKEKLYVSDGERELDQQAEFFMLAKKILLISAAPQDLKKYKDLKVRIDNVLAPLGLGSEMSLALNFYDMAKKRDEIFFEKMMFGPKLSENMAMVAGGFHTEGLVQRLRDQGISYIIITPSLGGEVPNEDLYFARLRELFPSTQTYATRVEALVNPDHFDAGFVKGVEILTTERNLDASVNAVTTYTIGEPVAGIPSKTSTPEETSNWANMSDEEKIKLIRQFFYGNDSSTTVKAQRVVIILRMTTLKKLLSDDFAIALWKREMLSNRANTIIVIRDNQEGDLDQITNALSESKAIIKLLPAAEGLAAIIKREKEKLGAKIRIGVIDDKLHSSQSILVLPPHPASLFLLRPLLENPNFQIPFEDPTVIENIMNILQDLYLREGFAQSA